MLSYHFVSFSHCSSDCSLSAPIHQSVQQLCRHSGSMCAVRHVEDGQRSHCATTFHLSLSYVCYLFHLKGICANRTGQTGFCKPSQRIRKHKEDEFGSYHDRSLLSWTLSTHRVEQRVYRHFNSTLRWGHKIYISSTTSRSNDSVNINKKEKKYICK